MCVGEKERGSGLPEAALTLTAHADGEALLQAAVLAAVAVEFGHRAVLAAAARVADLQCI